MSKQDIVSEYWFKKAKQIDEAADKFDLTAHHYGIEKHLAEVGSIIGMNLIDQNYNLLDLACGNGRLCQLFYTDVKYIIGIDLCDDFISYLNNWKAKNKVINVEFLTMDLTTKDFASFFEIQFDTILFFGTAQFIIRDAHLKNIFKNVSKLMKDGGKFLLKQTTSVMKDDVQLDIVLDGSNYITRYRTVPKIKRLANKSGLKVLSVTEVFNKDNVGDAYQEIEPWDNTKQMFFLFEEQ